MQLALARDAERGVLLSVSHDLRTPLTSIRGYAEGIEDGTVEPREGAAVVGREAARLERLVGDLLALARLRPARSGSLTGARASRRTIYPAPSSASTCARAGNGSDHGAGLGLAIVRELTEAMGGSATVENLPGGGAQFTIRLPRDRMSHYPAPMEADAKKPTADPWRLNEQVRRRRLREDGRRSLAVNLSEGMKLSEFLSTFAGSARKS